jgi:hypothetical protein
MRTKVVLKTGLTVLLISVLLVGCAGMTTKPTESNFQAPTVKLNYVEVSKYWGWWFFSDKVEPTKGTKGNYGAPLALAFIFEITNPNSFPIEMDELTFTVGFEEFDLDTVMVPEKMWIPAGKTNELRATSVFDARSAQLSMLVTGGFKLKEKGISFWDALQKYWTGISDFSFPVHVNQGSAVFKADGVTKAVSFNATFP